MFLHISGHVHTLSDAQSSMNIHPAITSTLRGDSTRSKVCGHGSGLDVGDVSRDDMVIGAESKNQNSFFAVSSSRCGLLSDGFQCMAIANKHLLDSHQRTLSQTLIQIGIPDIGEVGSLHTLSQR